MNWYVKCLKQYVDFKGRARRTEYWMFVLFNAIFTAIAYIIDYAIGIEIISTLYSIAMICPGLAVEIRRLHDIGKSGWWLLIVLIPIVGWILYLVWACTDSQSGVNKYGANPKEI